MAILVSGGCGYVGKWVVRLLAKDHKVINLDTFATQAEQNNVLSVRADLTEFQSLTQKIKETGEPIEGIIHLAAASRLPVFLENPYANVRLNVLGTINVLEFARLVGARRVVYASSGAVYGARLDTPDETAAIAPTELYGATKACGELLGMQYAEHFRFEFVAVRLFMVYGPGLIPSQSGEPFRALFGPLEGKTEVKLAAGSDQKFGFTYVADAATGIIRAFQKDIHQHRVYNISSGQGYFPQEVLDRVRKYSNVTFSVDLNPGLLLPRAQALDISLASTELGFQPFYDLDAGIREYAEWLQSQKHQ